MFGLHHLLIGLVV